MVSTLKQRVKRLIADAASVLAWIEEEHKTGIRLRLDKKLSLWARGFFSRSALMFDFEKYDPDLFVSGYTRHFRTGRINKYNDILGNKLACHFMMKCLFGTGVPLTMAVVIDGSLVGIDVQDNDIVSWLCDYLNGGRSVFAKPVVGLKGKNASVISTADELRKWVSGKDGYIITEAIRSHEYSAKILPHSLNTIRFLTIVDDGGPYIVGAVHRFGTMKSAPVDNWSSGGIASTIDLRTGVLGPAVLNPTFFGNGHRRSRFHPDTGAMIEGVPIPHWSQLCDSLLRLANRVSFLPYLGWDIAVSPEGIRVIEINGNTGLDMLQLERPLLIDKRLRQFYVAHRIIRDSPRPFHDQ